MKLTRTAVHRRISTAIIATALVVLGFYGLAKLPVDFLPSVTYPMVRVHVWWRGATPEEIEKSIADPIERQMATVDGLDYLESECIEGMYTLRVNFRYGVDVDVAYQDALAAMARVARQLPREIDPPIVIKADPSQLPIAQITVSSDRWDLVQLRSWTEEWLQDRLLATSGVAGTEIVGGLVREIRVNLDPQAIERHGLTLRGVIGRLAAENVEQFAGRLTTGPREFIARTVGEYRSLDEIRAVPVKIDGLSVVRLADIAEVADSHEEARVITRLDGEPCIKLSVLKQADANTVEVANAVLARLEEFGPALPAGVTLGVVENQADYIESALAGVRNTAIQAAALVILVVYLFLGSWRQVLVMALALPITLIVNFALMSLAGFSLNIFSLGGLVVSIGVLLSNTIVVVENITRWRSLRANLSKEDCVVEGTAEVGVPVIAATLTFLALFVPFILVPGLVSLLFRELILVIAGIVAVSLLVALTLTPMMTYLLLGEKRSTEIPESGRFERFFERVMDYYGALLSRALRHRRLVIAGFGVALLVGIWSVTRLGSEFLPSVDDGRVMVKVRMPTGAALGETDAVLKLVEDAVAEDPLIESFFTLAGGRVWGLYTYEIANEGEVNIQLVNPSGRSLTTAQYVARLRPIIAKIRYPGARIMVNQMRMRGIRSLGDADVEVKIRGQDVGNLFEIANRASRLMNELGSFTNVHLTMDMTKPEYRVEIDRARAADLGVSVSQVADSLRSLIGGAVATRFREGDEYYNVRVIVPEHRLASRLAIEDLPLDVGAGGYIRVRDVADVRGATGPVMIVREDQVKQVIVRGDAAGGNVGLAERDLARALEGFEMPVGYEMSIGGTAQMVSDMTRSIIGILALAVFFAFVVLGVQFDSFRLPVLILGCAPFCLAGAGLALWVTNLSLGATVIVGVLVVLAALANDGVLLLTFANQLMQSEGLDAVTAVTKAAALRLRPIVMTTVPVIVGFVPLALSMDAGGEMLQPMAAAAIGGLVFELAVALALMPCLYVMFAGRGAVAESGASISEKKRTPAAAGS